jgi:acetylornithine deacetylase/succinyl-diaminopimelate desuccinylase-like protein
MENRAKISLRFEDSIEILTNLIKIDSPYFHEDKIMKYVSDWLTNAGIPNYIQEYHERKITNFKGKNVISIISGGYDGPTVYLNGHLDTVMLCSGWTRNPFGAEIDNGKIYGLGALDMKGGCAAILSALKAFHDDYKEFHGKIIASFVSDEEGPFGLGTDTVISSGLTDDVDVSIVTEPSAGFAKSKFPNICLGARGGYGITIEFYGKSAHAANPHEGINAVVEAGKMVAHLDSIKYKKDKYLGEGCACVISIHGDGGACSVPDYAKVQMFRHIVPGETKQTIIKDLEDVIQKAGVICDYKIMFRDTPSEETEAFLPYTVPEDNEYVKQFKESCKRVTGDEASISYFQSIGDFNYLGTRIDAPCIIFGPDGANYHGSDEYATIISVIQTAEILYDYLTKLLCKL